MTKEEYVAIRKDIKEKETALYRQEREVFEAYRAEHRKFNDGDKVRITYSNWTDTKATAEVFISACNVHDDGKLYYAFRRINKNGTKSNNRFRNFDEILSIELLEPATKP